MRNYLCQVDSLAGLAHLMNRLRDVAAGEESSSWYIPMSNTYASAPPPSPRPVSVRPWHPSIAALWGKHVDENAPEPRPYPEITFDGAPGCGRFQPFGMRLEEEIELAHVVARILIAHGGGAPLKRSISHASTASTSTAVSVDSHWSQASHAGLEACETRVGSGSTSPMYKTGTLPEAPLSTPLPAVPFSSPLVTSDEPEDEPLPSKTMVTKATTAADLVHALGMAV